MEELLNFILVIFYVSDKKWGGKILYGHWGVYTTGILEKVSIFLVSEHNLNDMWVLTSVKTLDDPFTL